MAGLTLISTYSSDSEDEQSDRPNASDTINPSLPLPETISSLKGVVHFEEVIDDPSKHEGRTRSFKHERGIWATLAYIDYIPSRAMCLWMNSVVSELPIKGNTCLQHFHISVTRTLILKFHWIESFVDSLKKLCANTESFILELTDVKVYCNEERTRTFLGIRCCNSEGILNRFVKSLDSLLTEYDLPPFYEEASYHITFFWCLGDEVLQLNKIIPFLTANFNKFLTENMDANYVHITHIHCKIGNKLYAFKLK